MKTINQNETLDLYLLNKLLYKYFFFFGLSNFILSYLQSENLYLFFYLISVIIFVIIFSKIVKNDFFCFFAQISSIFLIILTQLTFIISVVLSKIFYDINFYNLADNFFYCDLKNYALANVYLSFFSISLIFFNKVVPLELISIVRKKINIINFNFKDKKLYILIILCLIVEFIYLFTGNLGSQLTGGFITKDTEFIKSLNEYDNVTWYTQFYYFITTFHLFLNLFFFSKKRTDASNFTIYFIIVSLILNFLFYGFFMRRMAIQFFFIAMIFFVFFKKQKFNFKLIIFSISIFFLIFQFTVLLQTIRTNESYNLSKNQTLLEILKDGKIQDYFSKNNSTPLSKSSITSNISTRIFNNHELASIFYYENEQTNILKGKLLLNHIIRAIPSTIFPNKHDYPISETLISTITDSPLYKVDTTDSFQSFSYADFGILGLIIYPFILNVLFLLIYRIINLKIITNATGLFIIMLFLPHFTIRITEINITDWLVLLRNVIIFILLFNFLFLGKNNSVKKI